MLHANYTLISSFYTILNHLYYYSSRNDLKSSKIKRNNHMAMNLIQVAYYLSKSYFSSALQQGMILLTLAVSLSALRPPSCGHGVKEENCDKRASDLQIGIFYLALYIIAIGTGGTKPNISTMGADQFDDFEPKERFQKLSFFNWWMFSIFLGTLFSNTFLVYIQDTVGWAIGYGLPTAGLAVSIIVFIVGTRYYRHKPPSGSPLTRMARVLVATVRKWRVVVPDEPKELYELSLEEYSNSGQFRLDHTSSLRSMISYVTLK